MAAMARSMGGQAGCWVCSTAFKDWTVNTQKGNSFCCNDGTDGTEYDGDGVTPVHSSLYLEGAEKMIIEDCSHFAWTDVFGGSIVAPDLTEKYREKGGYWYGSDGKIDGWASWLLGV